MIPAIQEINFGPNTAHPYATLHEATISLQEMGERNITTQVRIDGDIAPDFTGWELRFKGERFVLPHKDPQASKDNTTRNSLIDLTFTSWAIQELKRYFFFEPISVNAGTVIADKYQASVNLSVADFIILLNKVLDYYFDGQIVASLYMPGSGIYSTERSSMEIDHTYIWDVMVKIFEVYGVRWKIVYDESTGVYTIQFGYPSVSIDDHDFEYGYQGGLLRFERQVQDADLKNILLGRGGEKNLPYRYFKRTDPENPDWTADPDAIPELASIYFDRIRDINFRWYVRGWMHNPSPNRDTSWDATHTYPTYSISPDSPYYWAYQRGLTDEKFNPVEFVKDDDSIAEYGERWGALEDNDNIYPTIQGRSILGMGRIDETVAVSEIVTDDVDAAAESAAIERSIPPMTISLYGNSGTNFELLSEEFTVPDNSIGNVTYVPLEKETVWPGNVHYDTANTTLVAVNSSTGTEYPIGGIPAGRYRLKLNLVIAREPIASAATGTFGIEGIVLTISEPDSEAWKPTFDIWIKNIWETTQGANERDEDYALRVWGPILGDRLGNEAKIVFSSGAMSVSQDYEFTIVSYPVPDRSKNIHGVPSEWKITLRKSDAELNATGLFIPNASTGGKPVAGDYFFFTGIDMPFKYVELAEEELNTAKEAQLETESAINPTWVINLDKVRVHTLEDGEYGQTLADRLADGATVWITDPRFTPGQRLQLYVRSITYTWNEPSDDSPYLVPDIEVILSEKIIATESVVSKIQNEVQAISASYAKTADIEAAVRRVAEPIFLKKTGESDSSASPTTFSSKITSKGFRQGGIGGTGWGIYRDNIDQLAEAPASRTRAAEAQESPEGDTVIEVDKVIVRKEMHVNSLVINQIAYVGGKEVISAAKMEVSQVIENVNSYDVYFDQKQNSVANLFQVGDIAYGQRWSADESTTSYYKMVVTAVDINSITLGKSPKDGSGVPAKGDIIVQYGNTTDTARQFVIIRDVIGGGYERMLSGLSTVDSNGNEYYFAGRQSGQNPRWFVGDSLGEYAEWANGVLNIKGRLSVRKSDGTYVAMDQYILDNDIQYLKAATNNGTTLVDGGLILSSLIALGQTENGVFSVRSGINGMMNVDRERLGGGIAAWYGGPMSDKNDLDPGVIDYARSLFRFDGSGYLADGNIYWDSAGYGGIPGISWSRENNQDVVTIASNVRLASVDGDTVTDLLNAVNQISGWFEEVNLGTTQNPAWALRLKKKNGTLDRAFVTYGDQILISGTPGGGGGGGGSAYLYNLLDIYGHESETVKRANNENRGDGDLLAFNSTLNSWVALPQSAVTTDLSNYYTKSETYSKTEVDSLISDIDLSGYLTVATAASTYQPIISNLSTIESNASNGNTAYGYFSNGVLPYGHGGTGFSSYTPGDILYGTQGGALAKLSPNTTSTKLFLSMTSSTPSWSTFSASDILGSQAVGSSSLPIYYTGSAFQAISSLDLLDANSGYVKAKRFYLTSSIYFYTETVNGTPCVRLNAPFITSGDQIIISGTPSGGGGGVSYLYSLLDVYGHQNERVQRYDGTAASATDIFGYDSTRGWYAVRLGSNLSMSNGVLSSAGGGASGMWELSDVYGGVFGGTGSVFNYNGTPVTGSELLAFDQLRGWHGVDLGNGLTMVNGVLSASTSGGGVTSVVGKTGAVTVTQIADALEAAGYELTDTIAVSSVVGKTGAVTVTQIATALTNAGYELTDTTYDLPLAGNGTRGGIQIGYSESGTNYAVKLSNEKAYVSVPWTDTKNTAGADNTTSKIFLVGPTAQTTSNGTARTYSNANCYASGGYLYSNGSKVLTGNESITLSGDVSGSGTTSIAVTIGSGKVTNAMLAGSIAWSKLSASASDIVSTLGTTAVNRATADADGNTISSTYLKLSGGTMTGAIKLASGTGKGLQNNASTAKDLLYYSSSALYLGFAGTSSATLTLLSYNNNLLHRKYTSSSAYTDNAIWDASNSNLTSVAWACSELSVGTSWKFGIASSALNFYYSSSSVATLSSAGLFATIGDQVLSSDIALKTNLRDITYGVQDIAKARAVSFDWKDGRGRSAGSIAQDWVKLIPELVHGEEGNMSLAYGQLALINTIIEAREIDSLKRRVAELESTITRLTAKYGME